MPIISAPATVLVSGANGYIGQWIVYELLVRGYSVHGAVRSAAKVQAMTDWVKRKLPDVAPRFQGFIVPDITVAGAFDEAIKGVDGVVHTASPIEPPVEDPQAFIQPAVEGTLSILRSALKCSTVKRVVITSSVSGIATSDKVVPKTFTEADWNDEAVKQVEEEGSRAPAYIKYNASKTLSERAAWDFIEKNKSQASFDLSVINPSWVFGPVADDTLTSPASFTYTPGVAYRNLFANPPLAEHAPKFFDYVDIRDVTELHIKALEVEGAGGERIIANSELSTWEEWHANLDTPVESVPRKDPLPIAYFSNEKSKKIFGIRYHIAAETAQATVEDLQQRGWLKHLE
ncbi:NAD-P-binding protein [Trametes maxima]|nr:NAD-P-binding protein [Trametes maxima]